MLTKGVKQTTSAKDKIYYLNCSGLEQHSEGN